MSNQVTPPVSQLPTLTGTVKELLFTIKECAFNPKLDRDKGGIKSSVITLDISDIRSNHEFAILKEIKQYLQTLENPSEFMISNIAERDKNLFFKIFVLFENEE